MSQTLLAAAEPPEQENEEDFLLWAKELSSDRNTGELTLREIDERLNTGMQLVSAMAKEVSDMALFVEDVRAQRERITGEHARVELP